MSAASSMVGHTFNYAKDLKLYLHNWDMGVTSLQSRVQNTGSHSPV